MAVGIDLSMLPRPHLQQIARVMRAPVALRHDVMELLRCASVWVHRRSPTEHARQIVCAACRSGGGDTVGNHSESTLAVYPRDVLNSAFAR